MDEHEVTAAAAAEVPAEEFKVIVLNYGKWKDAKEMDAFLREQHVTFLKVQKARQLSFGFVHFRSAAERDTARPLLEALTWNGESMEVKDALPKRSVKAPRSTGKRKKSDGPNADEDNDGAEEVNQRSTPQNASEAATPWAKVPYEEQLERKETEMKKVLTKIVRLTRKEYGKKEKRVATDQRNVAKKMRKQEGAQPEVNDAKPQYRVQIPSWLGSHGSLFLVADSVLYSRPHEASADVVWERVVDAADVVAIVSFGGDLVAAKTDNTIHALKQTPTGKAWEQIMTGPSESITSLASLRGSLLCCTRSGKVFAQEGSGRFASGAWKQIGEARDAQTIAVHNGFLYAYRPSSAETQWLRAPLSAEALEQLEFEDHTLAIAGVIGIASHNTQLILLKEGEICYALSDGTIKATSAIGLHEKPTSLSGFASHKGLCCPMDSIHASPKTEGYRNKCEFSIGFDAEEKPCVGFRLGLFRNGSVLVGSPDECMNVPSVMKQVCAAVQTMIVESGIPVYDVTTKEGVWRVLTVRRAERTNDLMVIVQVNPNSLSDEEKKKLTDLVVSTLTDSKLPFVVKALFLQEYGGVSAATENDPVLKIFGHDTIEEHMLGMRFSISPNAFFQVNTSAAEHLYSLVKSLAAADEHTLLYDVCCGTGTIGICSSEGVGKVVGIEICKAATDDAAVNAQLNAVENVSFINSKAEDVMKDLLRTKRSESDMHLNKVVAIVDPPRAGLHHQVLRALRGCPPVQRIVYVSCNPTNSLIQDAVTLCGPNTKSITGDAFRPVHAIPVDMFPHTPHCEMVIVFERANAKE